METRVLEVAQAQEGLRVDKLLAEAYTDLTRSAVQRLLDEGHVQLQGKPLAKSYRVQAGDQIAVVVPPPAALSVEAEAILREGEANAARIRKEYEDQAAAQSSAATISSRCA